MTETLDLARPLDLYELMPTLYRLRDEERLGELRALLGVVSDQVGLLKADIDGLYDDLFIETCAEWAIPYIGDLVANNPIHPVAGSRRRDVARTIFYRRRKGVPYMLETLASDVTGWPAHVVPAFELLSWTQHLNHLRLGVGNLLVQDLDACRRVDEPFDTAGHTVDLRSPGDGEGLYGIHKVGFFLWRLLANRMVAAAPRRVAMNDLARWHVSPLGNPAPLFTGPRAVQHGSPLVDEVDTPHPISGLHFHRHPDLYLARDLSLQIEDGTNPVAPGDVLCKDLSNWDAPPPTVVAVDVRLGRVMFGSGRLPASGKQPSVTYVYGFGGELGGGPYERERRHFHPGEDDPEIDTIDAPGALDRLIVVKRGGGGDFTTLQPALDAWAAAPEKRVVIEIRDNGTYEPATGSAFSIKKPGAVSGSQLVLQAANGTRPALLGDIAVSNSPLARLTLNGLLVSGALDVVGPVADLRIEHVTLVPGRGLDGKGLPVQPTAPGLTVASTAQRCEIKVERSIVGPVRAPADQHELRILDSIVDAPEDVANPAAARVAIAQSTPATGMPTPGPPAAIERTTVFGEVHVRSLYGSESIFAIGRLVVERRQEGCLRFSSYVRPGSRPPRRYRCQPDLVRTGVAEPLATLYEQRVRPVFAPARYGEPAYAQLARRCAPEIRTGAEDDGEMGAFCDRRNPQREENLHVRLREYLPFGLEPGFIFAT